MYIFIKNLIAGILLCVMTTVLQAQENTQKPVNEIVETSETVEADTELDSYRIMRKEHPENPCERVMDHHEYEKYWYDHSQIYINSRFCEPALWFDNFFANDRIFEEGVAGTYVRWRNDFTYDEEDHFDYKMRLNLSVELPGFKEKLRLTFEGEEDEDLRDIVPSSADDANNSLSLQLDLKENARSKFNVSISLTPRIRFRYRYTYPVYQDITLRFTQEAQWRDGVNSARSRFDYEHALDDNFLFRSSSELKVSEEYDGADWLQAFVLFQWLDKKTSLSYETSVNGISEPMTKTIDYRLGVRFRKNFHREWLFYEIAPEYTWPITFNEERTVLEIDRRSKWRLFFRLEVHFGNAYRKSYQDYNKL